MSQILRRIAAVPAEALSYAKALGADTLQTVQDQTLAAKAWAVATLGSARSTADGAVARAVASLQNLKAQGLGAAEQTKWALTNPKKAMSSAQAATYTYVLYAQAQALKKVEQARASVVDTTLGAQTRVVGYVDSSKAKAGQFAKDTQASAKKALGQVKELGSEACSDVKFVVTEPKQAAKHAKAKLLVASAGAREVAADPCVKATAASSATGAVVMGTSGATTGCLGGAALGAVAGLPAALFTFGLSIPAGAVMGGGAGLCAGAVVGGGMGLIGGGATGYGVYTKRDELKSGTGEAWASVKRGASEAKAKAQASANYVQDRVLNSTGGTA